MKNNQNQSTQRNILKKILDYKMGEVEETRKKTPENKIRELARQKTERRPFFNNLKSPGPSGVNVIAEIKKASPSKGVIREDLDVARQAKDYQLGGASAISVLTDQRFFKGSTGYINEVKKATQLPVLRKDFIISTYQIYQSVVIGADAVLLIVRALSPQNLKKFIELCGRLNIAALVEVHNREELEIAQRSGATLIGINNRDLDTFNVDLQTSIDLVKLISPQNVVVSESGINSRQDIEKLLSAGIWNFLIGESLVRAEDPRKFLEKLTGADEVG